MVKKQTIQLQVHWIPAMAAGKLAESFKNVVLFIIFYYVLWIYQDYIHMCYACIRNRDKL